MSGVLILDYGWGNLRSLRNAAEAVGASPVVSHALDELSAARGVIIPGVGAFPHGMASLQAAGLAEPLRAFVESGRPVLGICLGMQLLFDRGLEFGETAGLGIMPGTVDRLEQPGPDVKLPHVGWAQVTTRAPAAALFEGVPDAQRRFYFVHSYAATGVPGDCIAATAEYARQPIVAAVRRDNVWGTQFHPEKSGPSGLRVLANFIDMCRSTRIS